MKKKKKIIIILILIVLIISFLLYKVGNSAYRSINGIKKHL